MKKTSFIIVLLLIVTFVGIKAVGQKNIQIHPALQEQFYCNYEISIHNQAIQIDGIRSEVYVMIFDSSGRNIYKGTLNKRSASIRVKEGQMYIVRIQKGKNICTTRILVQ